MNMRCSARIYEIEIGDKIVEIKSTKPLSDNLTKMLLSEDLIDYKIKEYKKPSTGKRIHKGKTLPGKPFGMKERLNFLLNIKGTFTRNEYIQKLKDAGEKISTWKSHKDIQRALRGNNIEIVESKKGKRGRQYKVIDKESGLGISKKLVEDRKNVINTIRE